MWHQPRVMSRSMAPGDLDVDGDGYAAIVGGGGGFVSRSRSNDAHGDVEQWKKRES